MTDDEAGTRELNALTAQEIPPEYREGAAKQLAALQVQARLVQEFQIPDEPQ